MIRTNPLSTIALLAALAVSGCAADATEPETESVSSGLTTSNLDADDEEWLTLELKADVRPAWTRSESLVLDRRLEFGPFPQPWIAKSTTK
jgi:hypothetical protein